MKTLFGSLYAFLASLFLGCAEVLHVMLFKHMTKNGMVLCMDQSIISKTPSVRRAIGAATGATNIAGGILKIDLDKTFLTAKHILDVIVSQTWGTNAPSSSDVRRMFSKIELISSPIGTLYSADFAQFYDLFRFTENITSPVVALGAGGGAAATSRFSVNMHHLNDLCKTDLLTALQASEHGSLSLQLTISPDASNMFIGGSGTVGVASVTVNVDAVEYPALSGKMIRYGQFLFGKAFHYFKRLDEKSGTVAGVNNPSAVKLESLGKTRFVLIHAYDTTGALPVLSNAILDKITLTIGGRDWRQNVSGASLQQENVAERNFNNTGVYVIDCGDDANGWPSTNDLDAALKYTTLATTPAGWKITAAQDFTVGLENSIAAIAR